MSSTESFFREVDLEVAEGDGRTLVARFVPWGEEATVNDGAGPYREMFVRECFDKQTRAANRIRTMFANFRHQQGFTDQLGHISKIEDREDGLYGEIRVKLGSAGDDALNWVQEGVLDRLSIEFKPIKDKVVNGVVQRVKAHLIGVALVPHGWNAYTGAEVLAVRETDEPDGDDEPPDPDGGEEEQPVAAQRTVELLPPRPPELVERLERLGIDTQQRAVVDTPWDGSASRYDDTAAYCAACLIDDNPAGEEKTQARCHLPIREPNGDVNINAVRNALARVGQVQTSAANKASARSRLQRILTQYQSKSGGKS